MSSSSLPSSEPMQQPQNVVEGVSSHIQEEESLVEKRRQKRISSLKRTKNELLQKQFEIDWREHELAESRNETLEVTRHLKKLCEKMIRVRNIYRARSRRAAATERMLAQRINIAEGQLTAYGRENEREQQAVLRLHRHEMSELKEMHDMELEDLREENAHLTTEKIFLEGDKVLLEMKMDDVVKENKTLVKVMAEKNCKSLD